MCGITGKIKIGGTGRVTAAEIHAMNAALRHRGPDDSGVYVSADATVGLGAQRLKIIDLSDRGHQPMRFADRFVLAFNGEIYNYRELRRELEEKGEHFNSETDTEVLGMLFRREGPPCVHRLRGMFAFAIYDEREGLLFCARDRLGKKPFKYAELPRTFLFASELKALRTQSECPTDLDWRALHEYFTLQYVPAPRTGFMGIRKLPPAHTLTLDVRSGRTRLARYWQLSFARKEKLPRAEWTARIRTAVDEAVRIRLHSDVPLGVFLSGGLDSSAVAAFASRHAKGNPLRTFTVGFAGAGPDERPAARRVAEHFRTRHAETVLDPNVVQELPALVRHFDEPFGDSSALPTFLLARAARPHITVALLGDGGDENFGGYPRYSVVRAAALCDRAPLLRALAVSPVAAAAGRTIPGPFGFRFQRFQESLKVPLPARYAYYIGYLTPDLQRLLYGEELQAAAAGSPSFATVASAFRASGVSDSVEAALAADLATYLPDDLLVKADLATMAHSLEARSPLLDHRLLELTATMPVSLKVSPAGARKVIFREALEGILPSEILARPKRGFSLPLDAWFRGSIFPFLRDRLEGGEAARARILRRAGLTALLSAHVRGRANVGKFLWLLLNFELWLKEIRSRPAPAAAGPPRPS